MSQYKVNSIFPLPIYETILEEINISSIICKKEKMYANRDSFVGGDGYFHTKDDQLFYTPEFKELGVIIQKHVDHFMREVYHYEYNSSYFSASWMNINEPGSTHHRHYHPNSIISGNLFIKTPNDGGNLIFFTPHMRDIVPKFKNNSSGTPYSLMDVFAIEQEEKKLVLFPSFLEHCVSHNRSNEERITLSFNVFIKGFLGQSSKLTYCKLYG